MQRLEQERVAVMRVEEWYLWEILSVQVGLG